MQSLNHAIKTGPAVHVFSIVTDHVEFVWHGSIVLHELDHVGPLALVRSDDPNLLRLHTVLHQLGHDFLHVGGFRPSKKENKEKFKR